MRPLPNTYNAATTTEAAADGTPDTTAGLVGEAAAGIVADGEVVKVPPGVTCRDAHMQAALG